jgi:hypothetical protein
MTFRDDHDAALARANALEDEVERTRRERDELAAKVKQLEAENQQVKEKSAREEKRAAREKLKKQKLAEIEAGRKRKERASSSSDSESSSSSDEPPSRHAKIFGLVFTVVIMGPLVVFAVTRDCQHSRAHDEWDEKTKAREAFRQRWQALMAVEPCLRRVAYDTVFARRSTPDKADPRTDTNTWSVGNRFSTNCLYFVDRLIAGPKTPAAMRAGLQVWVALQDRLADAAKPLAAYYSNGDWKEDNFAGAPALWAPVLALLERQVRMFEVVRRDVLPAIRTEVRALQQEHEARAGRDEVWWRSELGVRIWEVNDRAYEAAGIYAGREPDEAAAASAVRPLVVELLETSKQAPIEVRRILRKAEWVTQRIVDGEPLRGETPLWHLANLDGELIGFAQHEVIPALPPDPGPRPPDRE